MVAVPNVQYARGESGALAYQVWGAGPVDLLVMTEWPTSVDNIWEHPARVRYLGFMGSLGRSVRFDCRGIGASDPVSLDRQGDVRRWADDIGLVLDAVGTSRTVIVAEGFSGHAALTFAASHPERVERLALLNAFAQLVPTDDIEDAIAASALVFAEWGTGTTTRMVASLHEGADAGFFARTERLAASPMVASAMAGAMFSSDVRALATDVKVPTLVMHTGDLPLVTVEHAEDLVGRISDARLVRTASPSFYWGDEGFEKLAEFVTGGQADVADRELASVVFTDVVGSTSLTSRIGDRKWNEIFTNLDQFVRIHTERFGGRVVKHTGDGHLLTFPTPSSAIEAALGILNAAPSLGVELRAGVHTGEVEHHASGDVAGLAVHVAARVSSAAGAGELLVSRTVADLLAGSGTSFSDRGQHALKGVDGLWQLFSVRPYEGGIT